MPAVYGSTVKDSGKRRVLASGSRRDVRDGKGRFDLLPVDAICLLARHFEEGSKKYGDRNWEKGQPLSWYADSGMRHLLKHMAGESDERHDVAAIWNMMCLVQTKVWIDAGILPAELDDLPKRAAGKATQGGKRRVGLR
jgi:hypothetical protein